MGLKECIDSLVSAGKPTYPSMENGSLWCNATWDTVLCWPATPANTSIAMPCPSIKGLDAEKNIIKRCHESGHWVGHNDSDFSNPSGWTPYYMCYMFDPEVAEAAQAIAQNARKLEFVGLGLSFITLSVSIVILAFFRRLRVFRNQIHLQLMLAILLTVVIRLILYIDLEFTEEQALMQETESGRTINSAKILCEAMYFLLEYGKTVAFAWMFIEGFYLHNTIVVTVFQEAPKLWKYLIIGWGLPIIHVSIWLLVLVTKREIERCLGYYYLQTEFWIMDSVRLTELVMNFMFLLRIVLVLWYKVKDTHTTSEYAQLRKSVRAALMLIPLLGIPNIMQTIPFTPSRYTITYFAIFTYTASFFYMYQGIMVSIVCCFTNREVINVLKSHYERYRLQHSTADMLRRGSRAAPGFYHSDASYLPPNNGNSSKGKGAREQTPTGTTTAATAPPLSALPPAYNSVLQQSQSLIGQNDEYAGSNGKTKTDCAAPNNNRSLDDSRDADYYPYQQRAQNYGNLTYCYKSPKQQQPMLHETSPLVAVSGHLSNGKNAVILLDDEDFRKT